MQRLMSAIDYTSAVQQNLSGFDRHIGVEVLEATGTRVRLRLAIAPRHTQIHGIVHGGVYCTLVETACSIGAALAARELGRTIVGVDNHTSFLRATGHGSLTVHAEPVSVGRRTQLWSARITDDEGRLVASGQLRLLCVEQGSIPNASAGQEGTPFRV